MSNRFFFEQKTAYELMPSLVGSEMCISDGSNSDTANTKPQRAWIWVSHNPDQLQRMCRNMFSLESENGN